MPKIVITEVDNTTPNYRGSETVVFVPVTGAAPVSADENGCVLYKTVADYANISTTDYVADVLKSNLQVCAFYTTDPANISDSSLAFLQDKDTYNIKFLTSGALPTLTATIQDEAVVVDTTLYSVLTNTAALRKDCAVIGSFDVGNISLAGIKAKLDSINLGDSAKYGAIFAADMQINNGSYTIDSYPDLAYFKCFGKALQNGDQWEAIAGTTRGDLDSFNPDALIKKFDLDKNVMTSEGYSFNGIVYARPSGDTVWGDRTTFKNATDVKASSFLSIRNIVSDIAKRAYTQAVRYTFETNNEITWANFKNELVDLLDQMVQAQVLANYQIIKKPSTQRATIDCEIHLSPYGPVENFNIALVLNSDGLDVNIVE